MGQRGPVQKPSDARLRQNKDYAPVTKVDGGVRSEAPYEADSEWHPAAAEFWEAFQESAHTQLWLPTDWMKLYVMCTQLSRELKPQFIGWADVWNKDAQAMERKPIRVAVPMKGATLAALGQWMTTLGTTYADRMRMSVELKGASEQSGPPDPNGAPGSNVIDFETRRSS